MIEKLIATCKDFAIQMLKEQKEFYPFSFALSKDGKSVITILESTEDDVPLSHDVIENLQQTLDVYYPEYLFSAVAICVDVKAIHPDTDEKMDMIEIRIDSIDVVAVNYYVPYSWESDVLILNDQFLTSGSFEFYPK